MKLIIPAFENAALIPERYAYGKIDVKIHVVSSSNINPKIIWTDLPEGVKSLAVICVDDKVPAEFDAANKEGQIIPKDMLRTHFYHWLVVDIDPVRGGIEEGEDSRGISEKGKLPGQQPYGLTGVNDYSEHHGGYDGPCPPWNDELMHEYHFRLYALDVSTLGFDGSFTGSEVLSAMEGHIIEEATWMGIYSLNPSLRKKS